MKSLSAFLIAILISVPGMALAQKLSDLRHFDNFIIYKTEDKEIDKAWGKGKPFRVDDMTDCSRYRCKDKIIDLEFMDIGFIGVHLRYFVKGEEYPKVYANTTIGGLKLGMNKKEYIDEIMKYKNLAKGYIFKMAHKDNRLKTAIDRVEMHKDINNPNSKLIPCDVGYEIDGVFNKDNILIELTVEYMEI